jgi:hypothetical protein
METQEKIANILTTYLPVISRNIEEYSDFLRSYEGDKSSQDFQRKTLDREKKLGGILKNMISSCKKQKISLNDFVRGMRDTNEGQKLLNNEYLPLIIREQCVELSPHFFAQDFFANTRTSSIGTRIESELSGQLEYKKFDPIAAKNHKEGLKRVYSELNTGALEVLTDTLKKNAKTQKITPAELATHNEIINSLPPKQRSAELISAQQEVNYMYKTQLPSMILNTVQSNLILPLTKANLNELKVEIKNLFKPLSQDPMQLTRISREAEKMIIKCANQTDQNPEKIKQGISTQIKQFCSKALAFILGKNDDKILTQDLKSHLQNHLKARVKDYRSR